MIWKMAKFRYLRCRFLLTRLLAVAATIVRLACVRFVRA